ncbi:FUSC family protein [Leisingera sp. McT4-56]|uniref:FUSC family protein n=1 Tax=Leisingera sp. McT4-56 TaxID=2881255 RepID=UPI001CF80B4A|nr:FUSC family protein [Leisingera sp. McT4-56]MCB4455164.1 FUSC family protein [Leisingera sp. McT4-56]
MPDQAFDADAVLKLLKKSKASGNELPFAFGLAGKPENCGLMIDLRKPGKVLRGDLKKMPGIKKTCFGTLRVEENEVFLQTEKPVKGIVKQLKKRFKAEGMVKFKPVLVGPDGSIIDEDSLPDDDAEELETSAPAQAEDGAAAALKQRIAAAAEAVKALGNPELAGKLAPEIKASAKLLGQGDHDGCAARIARLEAALAKLQSQPKPAPADAEQAAKLSKLLAAQAARIKALPPEQAAPLAEQARAVAASLKSGALPQAAEGLKALIRALDAPAGTETETPQADVMEIWQAAKEQVDGGISELQAALRSQNHPVLAQIADAGLAGATDGNQTALMKALFEMKSATGEARKAAAQALLAQIAAYLKFLKDDPVIALVEDNPFGISAPVKAPLTSALRQMAEIAKAA